MGAAMNVTPPDKDGAVIVETRIGDMVYVQGLSIEAHTVNGREMVTLSIRGERCESKEQMTEVYIIPPDAFAVLMNHSMRVASTAPLHGITGLLGGLTGVRDARRGERSV
jgi:hypothetical protein